MDRETLAAQFLCAYIAAGDVGISYARCFEMANSFIAFAKTKKECEHKNIVPQSESKYANYTEIKWPYCSDCNKVFSPLNPPKPPREARVFWIRENETWPWTAWTKPSDSGEWIKCVEVLE